MKPCRFTVIFLCVIAFLSELSVAAGPESQRFAGRHDNTDVAKIITSLLQ